MKLAGYIRVSTEAQAQADAYGKDVQRAAIERWAGLNEHEIVAWFEEDGVSGKIDSGDRPALRALIETEGIDGMVAFDATRIARRLLVQETLVNLVRTAGLAVFSTTSGEMTGDDDDPTRIMIRQILGVIAEFDHRNTVNRLHSGRKVKSAQGGYIGGVPPYGMRVVGTGKVAQLVEDEVESEVIKQILNWHEHGISLRSIARTLNDAGTGTKQGKEWTAVQVGRIIRRNRDGKGDSGAAPQA